MGKSSRATLQKYTHDLNALLQFLKEPVLTKTALISWKEQLVSQYAPASVNAMLAAVNGYLHYMGWTELMVKPLKIQCTLFLEEEKELTKKEYVRLVHAAQKSENERLSLVIQTICATGIRVSELKFITVEAVQKGRAEISNKGKMRLLVAVVGVAGFLKFYNNYIDETLYAERLSQMREVTTQLFSGLEDVVANQWNRASNSCRRLQDANPGNMDVFPAKAVGAMCTSE